MCSSECHPSPQELFKLNCMGSMSLNLDCLVLQSFQYLQSIVTLLSVQTLRSDQTLKSVLKVKSF